ncbi:hypothetical protein CPB84DRAFT_1814772 [Gymnopilus junonius]|uniref:SET domain-containing protein n=1 Tax=Gymnopilus junonius TaxID=109634 RepID=A0A9P5TQ95_GYMJU|nr:hypothetical protein CPB84DRAFT_1814772 [Gymnopilus junonius]
MQVAPWLPQTIKLVSHPKARDQSVATTQIKAGSSILTTPAFASILLDSEKGRRCDNCFRLPQDKPLRRCTGCGSYWYCNAECQNVQWRKHHKRICKTINVFTVSPGYQALPLHEKHDSILLSHVIAQMSFSSTPYSLEDSSLTSVFLSLLPHADDSVTAPVICPIKPPPPAHLLQTLYTRFGNNNFAIHSHLNTIGHGIFPIASRLFNHSCLPNAAAKYHLSPDQSVVMEIVALQEIQPGEQICLPYLDPALLQTRQQILEISYGFKCRCPSCSFLNRAEPLPEPPIDPKELSNREIQLRNFVGFVLRTGVELPKISIETTLPALRCFLRESYMADLSNQFRDASHESQYDLAFESGITLLSLYLLVYPENYPQIGMHLLELAKTSWNRRISSPDLPETQDTEIKSQVQVFLSAASRVLTVLGEEGDDDGPLKEIAVLERLLSEE